MKHISRRIPSTIRWVDLSLSKMYFNRKTAYLFVKLCLVISNSVQTVWKLLLWINSESIFLFRLLFNLNLKVKKRKYNFSLPKSQFDAFQLISRGRHLQKQPSSPSLSSVHPTHNLLLPNSCVATPWPIQAIYLPTYLSLSIISTIFSFKHLKPACAH